jgi:hypothetical protein
MTRVLGVFGAMGVGLLTTLSAAAGERDAGADDAPKPQAEVQRNFALGAQAGFYNPNGLALRAGFRPISLEAAAGWVPTLLSYGGDRDPTLKLIAPFELTPQLVLGDVKFGNDVHGALRIGYRYNLTLGHGVTLGGQLSKRWGHLQLEGLWGVSIFPDAVAQLRKEGTVPEDPSYNFPPSVNWGLTVGLMYYP